MVLLLSLLFFNCIHLFDFILYFDLTSSLIFHEQLEPADPDFYKIGYVRSVRAYGIEFREGPDGFGVYASKDVEPLRRARVSIASSSCYTMYSAKIKLSMTMTNFNTF